MHHIGPRPRVAFPEEYGGYRLRRDLGCVYAAPPPLDPEAIARVGMLDGVPGVLCATSLDELKRLVDEAGPPPRVGDVEPAPAAGVGAMLGASPVEFAGWLPVYGVSGNCGKHPQFKHTDTPPPGYRFTRSGPPEG